MKSALGLLIIAGLFSIGCSKQLEDYVRGGPDQTTDNTSSSNPAGIRISPGANTVSGTQVKSQFAITTMARPITGTQVKGTISFHQTRPE